MTSDNKPIINQDRTVNNTGAIGDSGYKSAVDHKIATPNQKRSVDQVKDLNKQLADNKTKITNSQALKQKPKPPTAMGVNNKYKDVISRTEVVNSADPLAIVPPMQSIETNNINRQPEDQTKEVPEDKSVTDGGSISPPAGSSPPPSN